MQVANVRHKFNLHWPKVIALAFVMLSGFAAHSQIMKRYVRKNNPNYDDRKFSYGFLIGLHTSTLQLKYSDAFVTQDFDTVYAVQPKWKSGFSLGFIVNYKAADYLDFRITPKVSFYEHEVNYVYTDKHIDRQLVETTMVEFPFLAKYKSARRGNVRMYMIGGITPGIEASGKKEESPLGNLELKGFNLSLEGGFGFDLYYPLFKFSPEIRFSRGIMDMLGSTTGTYGSPLKQATMNTISVYLLFQ